MGIGRSKVAPTSPTGTSSRLKAREASFSVRGKYGIFVSREVGDGAKDLANDANFRSAFTQFVKSGVWLEAVAQHLRGPVVLTHEERMAIEKGNVAYEYRAGSIGELRELLEMFSHRRAEALFTSFPSVQKDLSAERRLSGPSKHTSIGSLQDCYLSIDNFCRLNQEQLVSLLIAILYPIFLRCPDKALFMGDASSEKTPPSPGAQFEADSKPLTKSSRRMQDFLLSCAATFDESVLLGHMEASSWLSDVDTAFEDCRLPISIVDTNRENCPLVYVNASFEEMYGRSRGHILGKRLNLMNGPDTELALFEFLAESVQAHADCKVAITNYNKRGDSFLNFLAVRASGGFTYVVHCPSNSPTFPEDIKVVLSHCTIVSRSLHCTSRLSVRWWMTC
jgi:PAS domain-containing protein